MPTTSFRLPEEDKKRFRVEGSLSDSQREAVGSQLNSRKSEEEVRRLRKLQEEDPVEITSEVIVRIVRE